MSKKIISLLLCAVMLITFTVACTKPNNPDEHQSDDSTEQLTSPSDSTSAENQTPVGSDTLKVDENGYLLDELDQYNLDFKGDTVNILYWEDVENVEYFVEGLDADIVHEAIYKRNDSVTKRLNVKLNYIPTLGDSGNCKKFVSKVQIANDAGGSDDTERYDIASAHSRTNGLLAYSGYTRDLKKLKYLDFEKPWWSKTLLNESTINGQLHFASGDISTNVLYMMYVVFYNKQFMADKDVPDPVQFVDNKTWTIDKMIELCENTYDDVDLMGEKDTSDRFGLITRELHLDAFLQGSNIITIVKNNDGKMELSQDYLGEKTANLIQKLSTFFSNTNDAYLMRDSNDYKKIFERGDSMFIIDRADIVITDIESEFDIGILPIPMYDESQKVYKTLVANPFSLYSVTRMSKKADMAGAVLECLASESYRRVTPAVFEITMKLKYADGSDSARMYDIARENVVYDLGRIFYKCIADGAIPDTFTDVIKNGNVSWSTKIRIVSRTINADLKKVQEAFDGFKD